ncbi:MAG: S-adenosylmethionine:tRNA ribosyltransferase-isomerase [Aeromicrobium sp.]
MTVTTLDPTFVLPPNREATEPPEARGLARDEVRLLVSGQGIITHAHFHELPRFMRSGDLLVVNDSSTTSAAVDAQVDGIDVVLHFSTWLDDGSWVVEVRSTDGHVADWARLEAGLKIRLPHGVTATLVEPWLPSGRRLWTADIRGTASVVEWLARQGRPITYSYVRERWSAGYYETVFGRRPGSAEMPSAGRPFTDRLVTELVASGIAVAPITLHTGVSSPESGEPPSPERFAVSAATARLVEATRAAGHRVIAVGTTVTRALETVATEDGLVRPDAGWTNLVLSTERPTRVVDGLITGWHAPGASHLDLLEAVVGPQAVREAYDSALKTGYLWHEFGDSALLLR